MSEKIQNVLGESKYFIVRIKNTENKIVENPAIAEYKYGLIKIEPKIKKRLTADPLFFFKFSLNIKIIKTSDKKVKKIDIWYSEAPENNDKIDIKIIQRKSVAPSIG